MKIKMLNNYILCEEVETPATSTFGFKTESDSKVKTVRVVESSEEDIEAGSLVKIISTAGLVDNDSLIIRRSDIIYIV